MELKDFDGEVEVNPEGFMFDITCKKCKSQDIIIETQDDVGQGSEYTGMYGDAKIVIKCKGCGNAYAITAFEA